MLKVFDGRPQTLAAIRGIHVILENRVFVVQQMIVDLGFREERHLGLRNALGLQIIVHGLPLLPHNTKVLDEQIEALCPVVVERLSFENPVFRVFGPLRLQILLGDHVMTIPDLLEPAAQSNTLLVELNGFFGPPQALIGLGEVEMCADVGGLFFKFFLEHL